MRRREKVNGEKRWSMKYKLKLLYLDMAPGWRNIVILNTKRGEPFPEQLKHHLTFTAVIETRSAFQYIIKT